MDIQPLQYLAIANKNPKFYRFFQKMQSLTNKDILKCKEIRHDKKITAQTSEKKPETTKKEPET